MAAGTFTIVSSSYIEPVIIAHLIFSLEESSVLNTLLLTGNP